MEPAGSDIPDEGRLDVLGEVPGGQQREIPGPAQQHRQIGGGDCLRRQAGCLDLAVEMSGAAGLLAEMGADEEGLARRLVFRGRRLGAANLAAGVAQDPIQGLVMDHRLARIEARENAIPAAGMERALGGKLPAVQIEGEPAGLVQAKAIAAAAQDGLGAGARKRRPDEGRQSEASGTVEGGIAGHQDMGAAIDRLPPPRMLAVDGGVDLLLAKARAVGTIVAADEAHDLGAIAGRAGFHAHLEGDFLPRPDGEAVGIAHDLDRLELSQGPAPRRRIASSAA